MQQPLEHWSMALRSGDLSGAVWSPAWWSRLSSGWEVAQLQKLALSIMIHDVFFLLPGWVWVEWRKGDSNFFYDSYLRLGASWGQAQDEGWHQKLRQGDVARMQLASWNCHGGYQANCINLHLHLPLKGAIICVDLLQFYQVVWLSVP